MIANLADLLLTFHPFASRSTNGGQRSLAKLDGAH